MTIPRFEAALRDLSNQDAFFKALRTLSDASEPVKADTETNWPIWA